MLARQRHREILTVLDIEGSVRVSDLAQRFEVTEETIRRDLDKLETSAQLQRSHGGAVPLNDRRELPHGYRASQLEKEKTAISKEAAGRVREGETILLDASSTAWFMARYLKDMPLTVLTNSVNIMTLLAPLKHIRIQSLGGTMSPTIMGFVGPLAEENLKRYNVDQFYFSCRGLDLVSGLSDPTEEGASLKKAMIAASRNQTLLLDNSKFGIKAFAHIAGLDCLQEIITDSETPVDTVKKLEKIGIRVTRTA